MAEQLGLPKEDLQEKIPLGDAIKTCRDSGYDGLILDQIREDSIGKDLILERDLDPNHEVRIVNLVTFLFAQKIGFSVIKFLLDMFEQVEMLEQCGDFYKLRVPKGSKTIGWLFGQLEENKQRLEIQEYSVSQTTLEQIFQMFANQAILEDKNAFVFKTISGKLALLNPDKQAMPDQDELASRGMSKATSRAGSLAASQRSNRDSVKLIDQNA